MLTTLLEPTQSAITPEVSRKAMRQSMVLQCAGGLSHVVYTSGILLLFMQRMGLSAVATLIGLSLIELCKPLSIPAGNWCDHRGIKPAGMIGLTMTVIGFALVVLSATTAVSATFAQTVMFVGIIVYSAGHTIFAAGWFVLLSGFVPPETRGRYFGTMRLLWQTVGAIFAGVCMALLSKKSELWEFQLVLGIVFIGQIVRMVLYPRLPEVDYRTAVTERFGESFRRIMQAPQFVPFCAYVFLLSLFTVGAPSLFALTEKTFLELSDKLIVLLGTATMVGFMAGFAGGGFLVDRLGTKMVFLICHFGFAITLLAYPLRVVVPGYELATLFVLHTMYGIFFAASSIAISTEMLGLLPSTGRSLATSVCMTLQALGAGMSSVLAAGAVKLGMLQESWPMLGGKLSQYDAILIVYGILVALMVVALGLVPSIVGKAQWVPRDR